AAAVLTVASASMALGAAFDNGGFENVNYSVSQDWGQMVVPGQSNVTGWVVTGHSVDIIKGRWPAYSGTFSIDLNGLGAGAISQKLETAPGKHYFVDFQMAGNPEGPYNGPLNCHPNTAKSMTVSVDGAQDQDFTFSTAGTSLA